MTMWNFILRIQGWKINKNYHIKKIKNKIIQSLKWIQKKHLINLSIVMILSKLGMEENFLNLRDDMCKIEWLPWKYIFETDLQDLREWWWRKTCKIFSPVQNVHGDIWSLPTHLPNPMCHDQLGYWCEKVITDSTATTQLLGQ